MGSEGKGREGRRGENGSLTACMREEGKFIRFLPRKAINETSCRLIHARVFLSFVLRVCVCLCVCEYMCVRKRKCVSGIKGKEYSLFVSHL